MDDNMRHAISKLSHLHFVSHINYKKRLIQMGENKKDIHVVGAMGIESLKICHFVILTVNLILAI